MERPLASRIIGLSDKPDGRALHPPKLIHLWGGLLSAHTLPRLAMQGTVTFETAEFEHSGF